jgi:hypothetical protein
MKLLDYGAVLLAAAVTAGTALGVYAGGGAEAEIRIRGPGASWVYPRDAAELVRVPGPLGETVVELRDGAARILSSPCANQLCVAAGAVHSRGQWAACLPNQVLVAVEERAGKTNENGGDGVDAAAW